MMNPYLAMKTRLPVITTLTCLIAATALSGFTQPAQAHTRAAPASHPVHLNQTAPAAQTNPAQPVRLTGYFTYTNDLISSRFTENAIALTDFHGFVTRDREWELPVAGQVLGYLKFDVKEKRADYWLQLPISPTATLNDVDNNGGKDAGVQIYALHFFPNIAGGPYAEGDDIDKGWPSFLASVVTSDADDEVLGGKLVVWSPDAKQSFPSGFGDDGKLFTADDKAMALPAGWSVIDLDQKPFAIVRTATVEVLVREPVEIGVKDYAKLSYTEAFQKLLDDARRSYAFNGVEGKEPDWDALEAELMPEIQQAEDDKDAVAYFQAIRKFVLAFQDGHVQLNTTNDELSGALVGDYVGGYGLVLRELDDSRVIAVQVFTDTANNIAGKAGILPGAEILTVDGTPIAEVIEKTQPLSAPFSSEHARRQEQIKYVLHNAPGTRAVITFQNPGKTERKVTLTSKFEIASLFFDEENAGHGLNSDPLPIDFKVLPSNIGYIRVNSSNDDLNLTYQLLRRAFGVFETKKVNDLIIDLRFNGGGTGLGIAEFLITQTITDIVIPSYYSETEGKFINSDDVTSTLKSKAQLFDLNRLAVLVSTNCASACEVESQELSEVPGAIVVGYTPTAGIFADVARGQYKLPENVELQIPKIRFTKPDGELYLEGKGVEPTELVPMTYDNAMNWRNDPVLMAAEEALQN